MVHNRTERAARELGNQTKERSETNCSKKNGIRVLPGRESIEPCQRGELSVGKKAMNHEGRERNRERRQRSQRCLRGKAGALGVCGLHGSG
jgi:hypothetical protein